MKPRSIWYQQCLKWTKILDKLCYLENLSHGVFDSGIIHDCEGLRMSSTHNTVVDKDHFFSPCPPFIGCVFFLCLGIFYMFRPNISFVAPLQEKVVFGLFFLGAILCLSFSWLFHTVYCHSEGVSRLFSK